MWKLLTRQGINSAKSLWKEWCTLNHLHDRCGIQSNENINIAPKSVVEDVFHAGLDEDMTAELNTAVPPATETGPADVNDDGLVHEEIGPGICTAPDNEEDGQGGALSDEDCDADDM